MIGVLIAAVTAGMEAFIGWFTTEIVIKMLLYGGLLFFVSDGVNYIIGHLPNSLGSTDGGLSSAHAGLSSAAWYFYDVFDLGFAISNGITAVAYRFMIRRVPLIG